MKTAKCFPQKSRFLCSPFDPIPRWRRLRRAAHGRIPKIAAETRPKAKLWRKFCAENPKFARAAPAAGYLGWKQSQGQLDPIKRTCRTDSEMCHRGTKAFFVAGRRTALKKSNGPAYPYVSLPKFWVRCATDSKIVLAAPTADYFMRKVFWITDFARIECHFSSPKNHSDGVCGELFYVLHSKITVFCTLKRQFYDENLPKKPPPAEIFVGLCLGWLRP